MPQLGETVTEGTIIKWLKNVGDAVAHDEPLFEVSTDKVDSEVPSPAEGVLTKILVEEGGTVDVGTTIAVIGDAGEAPAEDAPAEDAPAEEAPAAASAPATSETVADSDAPAAADAPDAPVAEPDAPPAPAAGESAPAEAVAEEASVTKDAEAAKGSGAKDAEAGKGSGASAQLSPVVRKLLSDNSIDASEVKGTGAGGRITRNDVLAVIDARASDPAAAPADAAPAAPSEGPAAAAAPAPAAAAPAAAAAPPRAFAPATAGERDEVVAFSNIRRLTAEHMVRSKATSAHTLVAIECDYEAIEKVRRASKDQFKSEEGVSLSYLPFIARAVVEVLREFPQLNASVGENALLVHRDINLGIAVDLDRQGLIVPVVRNADGQSLRGLARAIGDLAERARSRRLSADDVVGGTFTITNPGPFGTFITAPIINQPQVAILSTDGVKRRPVVVTAEDGTEAIAIHSVGLLALSFDHRAVDGGYASAFLYNLAKALETRDWAAEL
jgi:2-oxoglutarate dehydrogenase E2 component (dihydrolipoamide succinyltransferase)